MSRNPDWRESVAAAVEELPVSQRRGSSMATSLQTDFKQGAYGAVVAAAKERRVSLVSYARRATLAMAAHDLGIPLGQLLERDPRMARDTGAPMPDPNGNRFGSWEIERLVGES